VQPTADEFRRRFKAIAARFTPAAELDALVRKMMPTPVPAGTEIIQYQGPCTKLFFVWDGTLAVSVGSGSESVALGTIGPGEWIGEITLIEPGPASASVRAVTDSMLLALQHDTFRQLQKYEPTTASALLHVISLNLAERLRATGTRVTRRISDDALRGEPLNPKERSGILQMLARLMGIRGAS